MTGRLSVRRRASAARSYRGADATKLLTALPLLAHETAMDSQGIRRALWVVVAIGAVIATLGAAVWCRRPPTTGDVAAPRVTADAARPVDAPGDAAVAPGRGTRVLVDVSQGMAGFTRRGRRVLSALHIEVIEHAVSELRANGQFQRCALDEAIRCGAQPMSAAELDRADTYNGRAAALDLALRRPPSTSDPAQRVPDPLDPFEVSILATDGFQSARSPASGAPGASAACASGADPACIGELLAARVREGYGVWLARLHLPFRGTYFPERAMDDAMWDRVRAHVTELAAPDSGWDNVHFEARRRGRAGESGAFQWEGARPMLLFILSRNHALGRSLVATIGAKLRSEPTLFPRGVDADAAFAELAPFEGISGEVSADGVARLGSGPATDAVIVEGTTRVRGAAITTARCSIEGVADVTTAGALRPGAIPLPRFVRVMAAWRLSGPAAEGAVLVSPRDPIAVWPSPNGALGSPFPARWNIDCRRLAPGTHEHRFGVHVTWQLDQAALASEWYLRENVETSYEAPEKVFHLRQMVMPSLVMATARRGWLDQWALRLTRR